MREPKAIELFALSVDYGQRHRFELDAARRVAESLGVERHVVASVGLDQFGGSALTDEIDVPLDRDDEEIAHGIPDHVRAGPQHGVSVAGARLC